ncbi:NAD-dependent epimerase/dehydratase family protein [Mycobacterium sp. WMMD1722]|uniref:NAD-dependent epimerase/dehydratase family protein n=1 Tax=Mycobacterium sp. WMMD1722 TaxID=3404117 RepID=UPI003BF61765
MSDTVLVTGGFGLVGSQTVRRLAALGRRVIATDLPTDANRKAAATLPGGVQARWADLTDSDEVSALLAEVSPAAIIHLAAVIPPAIYRSPGVARKVNVGATATLVAAAEAMATPPRFIQASSNAVYGARNPYRTSAPVTADDPPHPTELYGGHKLEAEEIVRGSRLQWVVLRLGGVLSADPDAMPFTTDALFFESALPSDGRLHSVDVRDVAWAFAAATTADVVGEILLIAGDSSHKILQGEVGPALAAARGMARALPPGRPGNPDRDDAWFITDWMDPTRAQQALGFQHHSFPDMLAELRDRIGWKRYLFAVLAPLARFYIARQGAYRNAPGRYADPWAAIRTRLGEPNLDRS